MAHSEISDILTKARRSLTKVAQKAAAASAIDTFLDELPTIGPLQKVDQVSIKLSDIDQVQSAVKRYIFGKNHNFDPILFWIRDDSKDKMPILSAEIHPNRGFIVKDLRVKDHEYLVVTLPEHSPSIVGKLQHPAGSTVFKIIQTSIGERMRVQKCTKTTGGLIEISKVPKLALQAATSLNMLFDHHVYKIKRNGKNLAKIRPKIKSSDSTYQVEFYNDDDDDEVKSLALGVGLLLTLTVGYQEVHRILKASVNEDLGQ